MQRNMKAIAAGVIETIMATDPLPLPSDPLPLPDDPSESFGDSMRRVILWQADEIDRLQAIVKAADDYLGLMYRTVLERSANRLPTEEEMQRKTDSWERYCKAKAAAEAAEEKA